MQNRSCAPDYYRVSPNFARLAEHWPTPSADSTAQHSTALGNLIDKTVKGKTGRQRELLLY
jgi:hypothetical protein